MTCPQCFVGLCKKHLLQDSGKRSKDLLDQKKKLDSIHSKIINEKLAELQGAFGSSGTSDREQATYREAQEKERLKAEKRPSKVLKGDAAMFAASGMNGSTMQIMMGLKDDGGEEDGESDDGSGGRGKAKKKKKDKKSKKTQKGTQGAAVTVRFFLIEMNPSCLC